jgi:hypothetical protein
MKAIEKETRVMSSNINKTIGIMTESESTIFCTLIFLVKIVKKM